MGCASSRIYISKKYSIEELLVSHSACSVNAVKYILLVCKNILGAIICRKYYNFQNNRNYSKCHNEWKLFLSVKVCKKYLSIPSKSVIKLLSSVIKLLLKEIK